MKYLTGPTALRPSSFALIATLADARVAAMSTSSAVGGEVPRPPAIPRVRVSNNGKTFVLAGSAKPFIPWDTGGINGSPAELGH